jgi:hypothetical protein
MSRANMNAKEEFLSSIGSRPVKCVTITYAPCSLWEDEERPQSKSINLKVGYNETDWENFLQELDFDYDSGYGGQELYGIIWFSASHQWMTRGEYDGSEWWETHRIPEIPQELI